MSRRETVCTIAVIVVLLLAGCNSPLSGERRTAAETTDTVNIGDPETTTTPMTLEDVTLPESVNRRGIGNATALTENYARVIRNSSYTLRFDKSRVLEDGTQTHHTTEIVKRSLETDEKYRYTNQSSERDRRMTVSYLNGTDFYKKYVAGETEYRTGTVPPNSVAEFQPRTAMVSFLESRLRTGQYENPSLVRRDGKLFVKYRLAGLDSDAKFVLSDSITNVSGSVLVSRDGLVRRISMNLTKGGRGPDVYMRTEFRLVEVSNVTVKKPEWTDEAVAKGD
ncbi:DUF7537 family lipoprotein [Halorussus aquaticus]|uniref:Outer membrane lipoprotein-sorting protein n=1 Tax=Halorussus aquaticus TaxID=2953748 RepID=A0ABD5PYH6_9EURY|nr:hypothetical protein [Halorussus aquaticus]